MDKKRLILVGSITGGLVAILVILFIFSRASSSPAANTIRDILPFGSGDGVEFPTIQEPTDITPGGSSSNGNLFRVSRAPVAGFVPILKNKILYVRYTDRATGHIYDFNPTTKEEIKITNNTLPKIYEAHYKSDGSKVLYRFLKDDSDIVENLSLTLIPPKATSTDDIHTFNAVPLRSDLLDLVAGKDNTLFYVTGGNSAVATSNFEGGNPKPLYTSVFKDWELVPSGTGVITTTKPAARVAGYSYILSASGGLTKLLGPLNSLVVTTNKSGNRIAYSYDDGGMKLVTKNLTNQNTAEIFPATIAEKCVWSEEIPSSIYCGLSSNLTGTQIDDWYKGIIHYTDSIWSFDISTGISEEQVDSKTGSDLKIDVVGPQLSPDEDYLFFINKTDLSLWALKIN
jgi:hypothetical protein